MKIQTSSKGWEDTIESICREEEIHACTSREEVYNKVLEALSGQYGEFVTQGKINTMAEEVTDSVCKKTNIS